MKHFKALITITLIIAMVLSAVACNTNTPPQTEQPIAVVEATQEATEKPTAEPTEEPTPTPSPEPTPEPTPTVMKDRGTDFDKEAFFSYYFISESKLNAYIDEGNDVPEWYVEEDDVFENRYGFDIDYDGTDDYKQDWNCDGILNRDDKGFYWYCDDDNDGIMNVFDRDWTGFEWLPFGEGVLPERQEDVQHLAPDAESKYAEYEKLITDSYIAAYKEATHLRIENYEGNTIEFEPFGSFDTSRIASGHYAIETILQERCVRATNGKPLDESNTAFHYAPVYGGNVFMAGLSIGNYGCKIENIDEIEDLYSWFCDNAIGIGGVGNKSFDNNGVAHYVGMTDFKSTLYGGWFTAKQYSELVNLRVYTTIFDRDGETYIALTLIELPWNEYDSMHQRTHYNHSRYPYNLKCSGCGKSGKIYFDDNGLILEQFNIDVVSGDYKIYHWSCLP